MKAGEVWVDRRGTETVVYDEKEQAERAARRDAIIAQHSHNRQGRRAALRALRKAGLS